MRPKPSTLAAVCLLALTQSVSAQTVYNPSNLNPYGRSALNAYINASRTGDLFDFRNPLVRPSLMQPDFLSAYELSRSMGGRSDYGYGPQNYEEWIKQRESETRFSPSGQPIGFMIYSPYYDVPYQNSFIPSAINRGRLGR
jgi:hypothetical protein